MSLPSVGRNGLSWLALGLPVSIFYLVFLGILPVCSGLTVVLLHVHPFFLEVSVIADLRNMFVFGQ